MDKRKKKHHRMNKTVGAGFHHRPDRIQYLEANIKKIVQRTCVGCNIKKDKSELIRIVRQIDDNIVIDKTGKLQGRGAYICGDRSCLEKIIKSNKLGRTFEISVPEKIYEELRGVAIEQ